MKKWIISLLTILILGVVAYIVWSFVIYHQADDEVICKDIHIEITDSATLEFVDRQDVMQLLRDNQADPLDQPYSAIHPQQIQQILLKNKMIETVSCNKMVNGTVNIKIKQRVPLFRVNAKNDFYIDHNRRPMPTSRKCVCYVPVVTGQVEEQFVTNDLFDFITELEKDTFWSAQVEQINIAPEQNIELVPRVGNHIIKLGKLDGYPAKLAKLKELYINGFAKNGWPNYSTINLEYKDQVVCRKRAE